MANLNQLPDEVNLSFVAGDTFRIRLRVIDPASGSAEIIDPDPGTVGEPGEYKFCADIAKPDRTIVASFTISPDPDLLTQAVILTLLPTDTATLPGLGDGKRFQGLWDLEVTFPNGDVRTVAAGSVVCGIDVSHCTLPGP